MKDTGSILFALKEHRLPKDAIARINAVDPGRTVVITEDRREIESRLAGIEISAGDFPPDLLAKAPRLRWHQSWSAGTDWLQRHPDAKDSPFTLTSASGMHGPQMNEHLFGLILSWCRKFPQAFEAQRRGKWEKPHFTDMVELAGKTMLILGFGAIGEDTARIAKAFGLSVVGVRRSARPGEQRTDGVRIATLGELPDLLKEADFVVNILPFTQETRGMADRAFFSRMKKTALYANIGRGGTVKEADLVEALREGSIAGAVLDVTEEEPLSGDSPLWKMENVIVTAHYAGFHPRYDEIAFGIFLDNLSRYVAGNPLRNVVDKSLGY